MLPLSLPITSVSAIVAGVMILLLTVKVVRLRRKGGVVLGDNDDRVLTKAIRGHANAAEQWPIALIVMGLAEVQGASPLMLGLLACVMILGRAMHASYFAIHGLTWRLRSYGMLLTFIAQIGLLALLSLTLMT